MKTDQGKTSDEVERDSMSSHSPTHAPPPSASSLSKEHSAVKQEVGLLQALEFYPPAKLQGIHRHFVLYCLMDFLARSFNRQFTAEEVLQLLDRFYNLEMLNPEDEDNEILNQVEDFCLPRNFLAAKDEA